jgi:hypothetical protein
LNRFAHRPSASWRRSAPKNEHRDGARVALIAGFDHADQARITASQQPIARRGFDLRLWEDLSMTSRIGPEALRPNPALAPLTPLIGEWRTTGTHPLVPGTTFHGRTSIEWHEEGAFMLMRSEIDEPEIPSAVAVIGSDDAAGTFTMIYFDERDISRRYTVELADGEVRWHRDEAGFAQRMVLTIFADGTRLEARGTMSRDGGPWEDDLRLTYERIDS